MKQRLALLTAAMANGCTVADESKPSGQAGGGNAGSAGTSAAGAKSNESGAGGSDGTAAGDGGAAVAQGGDAAGGSEVTGGTASVIGGAGGEALVGGAGGEAPTIGNREWALWPMPNAAGSGLPHPAQYDTTKADVTLDRITGLTWEAEPVKQDYKWADAKALCDAATTGGYNDWRLPTRIELISIVDYSKAEPAVDSAAFPACESSGYWTATPSASEPNHYEMVDFQIGYGYADISGELHFARCVRGAPEADPPHYKVNSGYVTDNSTGLNWEMPAPDQDLDYAASVARCDALTAGGLTVWRLPTLKELQTLVDVTAYKPAMDTSVFTDVDADVDMFWSSSLSPYFTQMEVRWVLQVDTGVPPGDTPEAKHRSRCVF